MKRFSLLILLIICQSTFGFTIRMLKDTPRREGKSDIVYKQTQTGDENYFLHIKNVYVALPDLTKLFQSIGEHTTFEINYPSSSSSSSSLSDEDSECSGPYCHEITDFDFTTINKVQTTTTKPSSTNEESSDPKPTVATNGDDTPKISTDEPEVKPEVETIKNDKDNTVDIIESTTYKINTDVKVVPVPVKVPSNGSTHEIFIPVQVIV